LLNRVAPHSSPDNGASVIADIERNKYPAGKRVLV
jgi:hypothetical protein